MTLGRMPDKKQSNRQVSWQNSYPRTEHPILRARRHSLGFEMEGDQKMPAEAPENQRENPRWNMLQDIPADIMNVTHQGLNLPANQRAENQLPAPHEIPEAEVRLLAQQQARMLHTAMQLLANQPPQQPPAAAAPRVPEGYVRMDEMRQRFRSMNIPRATIQYYSGEDYEYPVVFLRHCQDYFNSYQIDDTQFVRLAGAALKGDADKWWGVYKNIDISWVKFQELIRAKYARKAVLKRLHSKLYTHVQEEKEDAVVFVEKKHLLARRLIPDETEENLISTLTESLQVDIRLLLRGHEFASVDALITHVATLQEDRAEMKPETSGKSEKSTEKKEQRSERNNGVKLATR